MYRYFQTITIHTKYLLIPLSHLYSSINWKKKIRQNFQRNKSA